MGPWSAVALTSLKPEVPSEFGESGSPTVRVRVTFPTYQPFALIAPET